MLLEEQLHPLVDFGAATPHAEQVALHARLLQRGVDFLTLGIRNERIPGAVGGEKKEGEKNQAHQGP